MKDNHMIQRQILEIDFPSREDAVGGQARLEEIYMAALLPVIDHTFSSVAGSERIVIDRLEVDLGELSAYKLEEQLRQQLESVLADKLHVKIDDIGGPSSENRQRANGESKKGGNGSPLKRDTTKIDARAHSITRAFEFFLDTGRLPWWSPDELSPADLAKRIISDQPENVTPLIQTVFTSDINKRRFIYQLPDQVLIMFLKLGNASETSAKHVRQILADLMTLHTKKPVVQMPPADFRLYFWHAVFLTWFPNINRTSIDPGNVLKSVLTKSAHQRKRQTGSTADDQVLDCLMLFLTVIMKKEPSGSGLENRTGDQINTVRQLVTLLHNRLKNTGKPHNILKYLVEQLDQTALSPFEDEIDRINANGHSTGKKKSQGRSEGEPGSTRYSPRQPMTPDEDESLEIQNAGLVILAQFLPLFFDAVGLVRDNSFVSQDAAIRAACLLEYTCTGEVDMPEHEMLLNKLFCGLQPDTPIPGSLEISIKESEEVDNLLTSVIEHWKALKGTSIRGIRQTFLNREGLLSHASNGWSVYIERKTVDVLIDHLPWGISILKLPWNEDLIYVEW